MLYNTTPKILQDFIVKKLPDGSYQLLKWKETLNGEPSTELVIPDTTEVVIVL